MGGGGVIMVIMATLDFLIHGVVYAGGEGAAQGIFVMQRRIHKLQ